MAKHAVSGQVIVDDRVRARNSMPSVAYLKLKEFLLDMSSMRME
jgi:abortive infection bacteriophage resistance protein